jgi:hypothetical protein
MMIIYTGINKKKPTKMYCALSFSCVSMLRHVSVTLIKALIPISVTNLLLIIYGDKRKRGQYY